MDWWGGGPRVAEKPEKPCPALQPRCSLSVGRLHPVKGMERVVRAWTSDSRLRARCNLVIVGGDLDEPSAIESAVLAKIDNILAEDDSGCRGLVMLGGRPRSDVAKLQIATALGNAGGWTGGGWIGGGG